MKMDNEASIARENVIVPPWEQGENLMFQRVLLKQEHVIKEHEQRKILFNTKCKILGKCCNFIIDGVITDNLVSTEVRRNTNLKCEPLPNPYIVSWLKKKALGNYD